VVLQAPGTSARPEVGIVAGRRVGGAVQRSRAKRRLREAAARVPLQPGTAYVLIASAQVVDVPFSRLVGWLERAVAGDGSGDEEDV
jgi:ribonuclease P protein component